MDHTLSFTSMYNVAIQIKVACKPVYQETESLSLNGDSPKGGILDYWGMIIFYRVETMDMGRLHCNNGVSGECNPIKYYCIYCTGWGNMI